MTLDQKQFRLMKMYRYLASSDNACTTDEERAFVSNVNSGMGCLKAARKAKYRLPEDDQPFYLDENGELSEWFVKLVKGISCLVSFIIAISIKREFSFNMFLIMTGIYIFLSNMALGIISFRAELIVDPVEQLRSEVEKHNG